MKVLIVGSGGREHALAWRIGQSDQLTEMWVAGGNAGTAQIATNLDINPEHVDAVEACAKSLKVDLVVVGPEMPLSLGLVDRLEKILHPHLFRNEGGDDCDQEQTHGRQESQNPRCHLVPAKRRDKNPDGDNPPRGEQDSCIPD